MCSLEPSSGSIQGHGDCHPHLHSDLLHAKVLAHPTPHEAKLFPAGSQYPGLGSVLWGNILDDFKGGFDTGTRLLGINVSVPFWQWQLQQLV